MKTTIRRLLALAAAGLALPAFAQTSAREYSLEIERQPIADALIEFSQQTGLQIGFFPDIPSKSVLVGPLIGRYTADGAIQLLLPDGFSFERLNERTIAVMSLESLKSQHRDVRREAEGETNNGSPPSFVRLAHVNLTEGPAVEKNVQASATVENARESGRKGLLNIEEIIVTAQRRAERLQDVPISISVLGGDELDRSTISDVTEALRNVPGVVLHETSYGGVTQVPVRGVAAQGLNVIDGGASPTAYYLDSVPFGFVRSAFAPAPDAYDLERVEVLRGPQGTLYGASALNGVVRVLTKDANPDAFELKARGLTSSTEDGGENYRADMAVNVPIVEGKLAARAVLGYQDWSGWIDRPNNKDANDAERRNMRLKINAQPSEELSIGLSAARLKSDSGAPPIGDDNGRTSFLVDAPISIDYDVYGLTIGYAFPQFSVTSMTSYLDFDLNLDAPLGSGGAVRLVETFDAQTFTQEVAINSTPGGAWRWSAGAMYRDSEDGDDADLPPIFTTPIIIGQHSKSYAVFGELTRLFLDGQWEFTAGLRYFEDDVTQSEASRWGSFTPDELTTVNATFSATTPRFVLTWHPREQMTVYASYSEGFRSGYHQFPDLLPFPPVEPDSLTNYELGTKGSLWGGRLAFDAALFYIDWQDIQQSLSVPVAGQCCLSVGINGESASGMGVDLSVTVAPVDVLELGFNASWNDLAQDEDVFSEGVVLFNKGDRLTNSAEYTYGASADYVFPLGRNGFEGRFSVSANYTSEVPSRSLVAGEVATTAGGPLLIGRASVSIRALDHWTASLFADNITNEEDPSNESTIPDRSMRVRPRTIGVQLEYGF